MLICVLAGHIDHLVGFVMHRLNISFDKNKRQIYMDTVLTLQIDHDDTGTVLHVSMTSVELSTP